MKQKTPDEIKKMHERLSNLPRMFNCENCGSKQSIERNHAIIYAGKRLNEEYALRALCTSCHRGENGTINRRADLINKINAIQEGLEHLKVNYPKRNWKQELNRYLDEFKHYL
jgi:5-methylcytosine-specific restriction endonuclease McrA